MACQRTLGKTHCCRDRGSGGDLRRLLRRAVVAAWRRADQSRDGDAVAGGGDRGKYRARQYRRGGRHPDRARRQDPHRRTYPRHHRQGSRSRHRGERAESRGQALRHRAVDGAPSRRKPQSGGCRTGGAHHPGRLCDGFRRRHRKTPGHRRYLKKRGGPSSDVSAPNSGSTTRRGLFTCRSIRCRGPREYAKRIACRPRLARQFEPDRT